MLPTDWALPVWRGDPAKSQVGSKILQPGTKFNVYVTSIMMLESYRYDEYWLGKSRFYT